MKKMPLKLLALAAALAIFPAAKADTFYFNYSASGGVSGAGLLVGTDLGSGEWLITSGTGTFNDGSSSGAITLTPNPNAPGSSLSPSSFFTYDDLLFPGAAPSQQLDVDGLLFSFGGAELNFWETGGGPGTDGWGEDNGSFGYGTFSASTVPEPGSLPLLGAGLLALAAIRLRRARQTAPVLNS